MDNDTNNSADDNLVNQDDKQKDNIDSEELSAGSDIDDGSANVASDKDMLGQINGIYHIWGNWAYFELSIIEPIISENSVVNIIHPEQITGTDEFEFVYPIFDYGNRFSTSKASEMYSVGTSMCKLYYTIEKIMALLISRLQDNGITSQEMEAQVLINGHQLAQRKAFESIINLRNNVVVGNFDPGEWGDKYLQNIKRLADLGYGFPAEAPRDVYRKLTKKSSSKIRR